MFRCQNCGQMFDSPNCVLDFDSEYWGATVHHYTSVCPCCGSDEYDEMGKCEVCGEWIDPGEGLCDNCRELIKDIADDIRGRARYVSLRYKLNYAEFISQLIQDLDE